jgi:hypothetical protein
VHQNLDGNLFIDRGTFEGLKVGSSSSATMSRRWKLGNPPNSVVQKSVRIPKPSANGARLRGQESSFQARGNPGTSYGD